MAVTQFKNLEVGSGMSYPIVFNQNSLEDWEKFDVIVENGSELMLGSLCTMTADGDTGDLNHVIKTGAAAKGKVFIVLDDQDNKDILSEDNSVGEVTKSLYFSAGSVIKVVEVRGRVLGLRLAASIGATVTVGAKLDTDANGNVDLAADDATSKVQLFESLAYATDTASIQWIAVRGL